MRFIFGVLLLLIPSAFGQDCTHLWEHALETGTLGPKAYNGDTHAAYAVFGFKTNSNIKFRLKGKFPRARFYSLESYHGQRAKDFDAIFDFQITPDEKNLNPFQEAVAVDPRFMDYSVEAIPLSKFTAGTNRLKINDAEDVGSLWLRYYSPFDGETVTSADLPRIEALDANTGAPASCPEPVTFPQFTENYPQFLTAIPAKKRKQFAFKLFDVPWAGNNAIPGYAYGFTKMHRNEVAVFRFRAVSFSSNLGDGAFITPGDVRYWSFCSFDLVGNRGLACLADYQAVADEEGFVNVVVGPPGEVEQRAKSEGANFLPDTREIMQRALMVAYRNVMPSEAFKETLMFKGDYNPQAFLCKVTTYLAGNCRLK